MNIPSGCFLQFRSLWIHRGSCANKFLNLPRYTSYDILHFVFIFDKHKLSFYISTVVWLRKYDAFDFSRDQTIEVPRDILGGVPSSWFRTLPSLGGNGPCKCGDKMFWINTWLRDRCVPWLCRWGSFILSHHPPKFGVRRPCEGGNITFFICHVTTILKCHVTLMWRLLILSYQLAKFGVHRPCESRYNVFDLSRDHMVDVTWHCSWGVLILSHQPAKFRVHRPCESGDLTFFIHHVTTISKCLVTLWVGFPYPKLLPC